MSFTGKRLWHRVGYGGEGIESIYEPITPLLKHLVESARPQNSRLAELSRRLRQSANGTKKFKNKPQKRVQEASTNEIAVYDPFPTADAKELLSGLGFRVSAADDITRDQRKTAKSKSKGKNKSTGKKSSQPKSDYGLICTCPSKEQADRVFAFLQQQKRHSSVMFLVCLPASAATSPSWQSYLGIDLAEEVRIGEREPAANTFYVILPQDSRVWFCGGWSSGKQCQMMQEVLIHAAMEKKRQSQDYCKVVRTLDRLEALGCMEVEQAGKDRLDHLFSKTPGASTRVRSHCLC
jgi:hypothetical protein